MDILVTGVSSSPGYKIAKALSRKHRVIGVYRSNRVSIEGVELIQADLTKEATRLVKEYKPSYLLHVASIGNVDYCEENREECYRVNVEATRNLVPEAYRVGSRILYLSTDYVFDGSKGLYTEEDTPRPINYYGLTKLIAEEIVRALGDTIVRVSSIYDVGPGRPNFGKIVVESLQRGEKVSAAVDQWVSPTLNTLIGLAMDNLLDLNVEGVIHIAGSRMSRYEFALAICEVFGFNKNLVVPISIKSMQFKAPRPVDSSLRSEKVSKLLGINLGDIKWALEIFKREYVGGESAF